MNKRSLPRLDRLSTLNDAGTAKLATEWFKLMQISDPAPNTIRIGIDEVGRGTCFGPLVVGAVANLTGWRLATIRDSKLIKDIKVRKQLASEIMHNCVWATIAIPAKAINEYGTQNTLLYAGRRVREELTKKLRTYRPGAAFEVIYDGRDHPKAIEGDCRIESIEKADATIFECSCASILAKATHDRIIEKLCENPDYARYGLINHRGYGTEKHFEALKAFGLSHEHRTVASATLLKEPSDARKTPAERRTQNHTDGTRIQRVRRPA